MHGWLEGGSGAVGRFPGDLLSSHSAVTLLDLTVTRLDLAVTFLDSASGRVDRKAYLLAESRRRCSVAIEAPWARRTLRLPHRRAPLASTTRTLAWKAIPYHSPLSTTQIVIHTDADSNPHHHQVEFAQRPSSQNDAALTAMRRAMEAFAALLGSDGAASPFGAASPIGAVSPLSEVSPLGAISLLGEFRRHLVLSKLAEGGKMLAVDDEGIR